MRALVLARAGTGGAARHLLDSLRGLSSRHEVRVLASPLEAPGFPGELRDAGASVRSLPLLRRPDPVGDLRAVATLREEIAAFRPDVVHAHTAKPGALARAAAGRIPVIYSPHGFFHHYPTASRRARRLALFAERRLARKTAVLATCSAFEREEALAEGLGGGKGTVVVPNGIPLPPRPPETGRREAPRDLDLPRGAPLVVMAARLAPPKEPIVFLEAARRLPGACFLLAGDGPGLSDCRRSAPSNALVPGAREDVPRLLAAADAAVLASRFEAAPYFVLEAMAAGAPLAVTDLPATREMLGDAALFVPPGDAEALAGAVGRLLDAPDLRAELSGAARARLGERFSPVRMLRSTEEAWEIARRPAAAP